MRYVVLWESPSFCQSISVIFLISYLGLFQENPPRWGGPENDFFFFVVCVGEGGGQLISVSLVLGIKFISVFWVLGVKLVI